MGWMGMEHKKIAELGGVASMTCVLHMMESDQNQHTRQDVLSFVCMPAWAVSWVTRLLVS